MNSRIYILILLFAATFTTYAQDTHKDVHNVTIGVPEVALLDLESSKDKNIEFNIQAPTEAGSAVKITNMNYDMWINYSSIVGSKNASRSVNVQITDGKVADGLQLYIYAWGDAKGGSGQMGSSSKYLMKLSGTEAISIITGIGSAYTGNGPNKGHRVLYYLTKSSDKDYYSKLNSDQSETLTITYTLTDD
ncbi:hypothetical protein SAMN05444411_10955 [Lutibacter oricola]|uniref:Uncharacterized protein n=1 Tax=Lutibacter oricola TaxID=762486 RepID=A0A1H3ECV8_9FLAO|nr:hypothetical protein [Lutibacter oricola]SDX76573.1 hypothetical protein SAMN05444411_10955 [Lutibacter oricola]